MEKRMSDLPPLPSEDINDGEIRVFTYRHLREYGAIARQQGRDEMREWKASRVRPPEVVAWMDDGSTSKGNELAFRAITSLTKDAMPATVRAAYTEALIRLSDYTALQDASRVRNEELLEEAAQLAEQMTMRQRLMRAAGDAKPVQPCEIAAAIRSFGSKESA
jgi:hypothetical protein